MVFKNFLNDSQVGLIIDWKNHSKGGWFSSGTRYLVDEILNLYSPIIIDSQITYNFFKRKLKTIISLELGVPKIRLDTRIPAQKIIFFSDPHYKSKVREEYIINNKFDKVLSLYNKPFFQYLPHFPKEKFVHFPWFVPNRFIIEKIELRSNRVVIFGGKDDEAYSFRNWCRSQTDIEDFANSGVENKVFSDDNYYKWLGQYDAVVCAGSFNNKFNLTTPKYFEVPAMGCLLIGQHTSDLELLGFNNSNSLLFKNKREFSLRIEEFKQNPSNYLSIRANGVRLIKQRHLLSHRIIKLKKIIDGELFD